MTVKPRSALRLAVWLACAALPLAGCAVSVGPANRVEHSAGASRASETASAAVPCANGALRIKAGREGENTGAHGDIEFTNEGSNPCVLRGLPEVVIVRADGRPLPVRLVRSANLSLSPVVLPPGRPGAADLIVYWANWCGLPPGPLSVRVTLAAGGVVAGPFDGPPDSNFVPDCLQHEQPSTVSVIDAYRPG